MTDLFANIDKPKACIGQGNAAFLSDLAVGTPDEVMRRNFKAGRYPDLHTPSVQGWRRLNGRDTQGKTL